MSLVRLPVVRCDHWHRGECRHRAAAAMFGGRPNPLSCARVCGWRQGQGPVLNEGEWYEAEVGDDECPPYAAPAGQGVLPFFRDRGDARITSWDLTTFGGDRETFYGEPVWLGMYPPPAKRRERE